PQFQKCCGRGQWADLRRVVPPPPEYLRRLLTEQTTEAIHFRQNIRRYNSLFAFTSFGADYDPDLANGAQGVYTFRIQGTTYGYAAQGMLPPADGTPGFLQIYFHDGAEQDDIRLNQGLAENLDPNVVRQLRQVIQEVNPYAQQFQHAYGMFRSDPSQDLYLRLESTTNPTRGHRDQYGLPAAAEVSAFIPGNADTLGPAYRDVIIATHGGGLQRIHEEHPHYDPLHYVLLFP
ncbi:hypothetical protein BCR43DRAFT_403663, partial [Syncephalastrum racemosum]